MIATVRALFKEPNAINGTETAARRNRRQVQGETVPLLPQPLLDVENQLMLRKMNAFHNE
jgi:hypothetical protein